MDKATSKTGLDSGTAHQDRADALEAVCEAESKKTCPHYRNTPDKVTPAGLPLDRFVVLFGIRGGDYKVGRSLSALPAFAPEGPQRGGDAVLERALSEAAASTRAPTLLPAGPGRAFRGFPPRVAPGIWRPCAWTRCDKRSSSALFFDEISDILYYAYGPQRFRQPGILTSPPEPVQERAPSSTGAGIWLGSPKCIIGDTGLQPLTSHERMWCKFIHEFPSPPITRAPLRVAPLGAAPRTVQVTEAAPLPDPSCVATSNDIRRPVSRFGRDAVASTSQRPPGPDLGIRPSGPEGRRPRALPRNTSERPHGLSTPGETGGPVTDQEVRAAPSSPTDKVRISRGGRSPSAVSRSSWGPLPPSGMSQSAARSTQHTGRPALREHPLDTFHARELEGTTPPPRRGRREPHRIPGAVGVDAHTRTGREYKFPLTVRPYHRAIEVRAINPYRHIEDSS
ncbi:hypothetical protein G5I_02907 [Acromyrmex echinatior]|uniref:Uncharacterized protein n=1 Tax=Acromyrmex echinatior TaxID=103372 RepID=F4WBJ4_ACREC|nr:hypothetical protein G5I_02907 [Acromyrmex echinatior]